MPRRGRRDRLAGYRAGLNVIHDVGLLRGGALARLLACLRRRFVGLGLSHQELFLGLSGAARQLRKLFRSEEQRTDDEYADDDRRVDDCEKRMYRHVDWSPYVA